MPSLQRVISRNAELRDVGKGFLSGEQVVSIGWASQQQQHGNKKKRRCEDQSSQQTKEDALVYISITDGFGAGLWRLG